MKAGISVFASRDVRIHPQMDAILAGFATALLAIVGLVLAIACSNLATLLLVRGAARVKEVSVRLAVGATRAQLVRHLLTESVLLALAGGAAGCVLAWWTMRWLSTLDLPVVVDFSLDFRVLGFALALSFVTGILFGLAPALHSTRVDLWQTLRDDGEVRASGRAPVQPEERARGVPGRRVGVPVGRDRAGAADGGRRPGTAGRVCGGRRGDAPDRRALRREHAGRPAPSVRAAPDASEGDSGRAGRRAHPRSPDERRRPADCDRRSGGRDDAERRTPPASGPAPASSRRFRSRSCLAARSTRAIARARFEPRSSTRGWRAATSAPPTPSDAASASRAGRWSVDDDRRRGPRHVDERSGRHRRSGALPVLPAHRAVERDADDGRRAHHARRGAARPGDAGRDAAGERAPAGVDGQDDGPGPRRFPAGGQGMAAFFTGLGCWG